MTINIFPTGFYRPLHMSRQTLKWLKKTPCTSSCSSRNNLGEAGNKRVN